MQKALVTGSNGFVGSHLVRLLLSKGYEVHCLVRYFSDISALEGLDITVHIGDVREPATLQEPVSGMDYIFHLAAKLLVTTQADFDGTNVDGTRNMLAAANQYSKPTLKRFLLVSSLAAAGPNKEPIAYEETVALNPISWYGKSKKKEEELAMSYADRLPVTIVRPAIVYGDREQDLSQIYPLVEYRIQPKLGLEKKAEVAVYVEDLVRGMVAAAESDKAIGQAYFLNHAEILSSKDIVQNIGAAMGKKNGLVIGVPDFVIKLSAPLAELIYYFDSKRAKMTKDKALEVTQQYWLASPAKAKRDFGWASEFTFLQGMQKTLIPYFAQKKQLREMALDTPGILALKYFVLALALGVIVEVSSYMAGFYRFHPWWLVFVIIIGAFGLLFGFLARVFRRSASWVQFVMGYLGAGLFEFVNAMGWIKNYYWVFKTHWPFGITNIYVRTALLSAAGGVCIFLLNAIMRSSYQARLSRRGDRPGG